MHESAYDAGRCFFELYVPAGPLRILDIGSRNVNGTLRDHAPQECEYVGVDMEAGEGVDVVLDDPCVLPFADGHFDVIVSTSCMEHDRFFWVTVLELGRVLKPGGLLYINAPSAGAYHGYPYDHWRFFPDAGTALRDWAGRNDLDLTLLESGVLSEGQWRDCIMVFQRGGGDATPRQRLVDSLENLHNCRVYGSDELLRIDKSYPDRPLRKQLEKQEASIERLQARNKSLKAEVASLTEKLAERDKTLQEVTGSASWRLTSPLRGLGRRLPFVRRLGRWTSGNAASSRV